MLEVCTLQRTCESRLRCQTPSVGELEDAQWRGKLAEAALKSARDSPKLHLGVLATDGRCMRTNMATT